MGRTKVFNNMWHAAKINDGDWLITNTKGDLIAETDDQECADHIVKPHNDDLSKRRWY